MPAPSSMLGRSMGDIGGLSSATNHNNNSRSESTAYQATNSNNSSNGQQGGNALHRAVPNPVASSVSAATMTRPYDEIFISKPVSEKKTMLWEIKDFLTVYSNRCERAMNFEFEVGRLGSMERHLPRRSRWKVMFDVEEVGTLRTPALRVLQLSPENKILFYNIDAWILERTNGTAGTVPDKETDFQTCNNAYKEGQNDSRSYENVFSIQSSSSCGDADFRDQIRSYIYEGSLFIKVKIEILEDASTQ